MILDNINLIYFVLKQMNLYKNYEEWSDVALIGLVKAAKSYNSDYKLKFSTFACKCIRNEILLEIRKNNSNKRKANVNCVSLEKEMYSNVNDDCILLKDLISSKYNLEEEIIKKDIMSNILNGLNDIEKYVLIHTYGLFGNKAINQEEIAKKINKSQAQISRTLKNTIRKIRRAYGGRRTN